MSMNDEICFACSRGEHKACDGTRRREYPFLCECPCQRDEDLTREAIKEPPFVRIEI
jgi:hypothetical protein